MHLFFEMHIFYGIDTVVKVSLDSLLYLCYNIFVNSDLESSKKYLPEI